MAKEPVDDILYATILIINMEDGPRIKIDLQGIFTPRNAPEEEQSPSLPSHSQQPSLQEEPSTLPQKSSLSPQRLLNLNITAAVQLESLTRMIREKESTIKKIQPTDNAKITAKLFQQKSHICSRSLKKQVSSTHCLCKQPPPKPEAPAAKEIRSPRSSLTKSDVHDRLYNMSKSQFLRQTYIAKEPIKIEQKAHRKSCSSLAASKYLKNYTPFEKRLEEYLNRQHFNTSQEMLKSEKDFRPQLIPSKYTDRVQSRYMQGQGREPKPSDFADFMNSSASSSRISNNNRSALITQKVQEHFMRKMRLVFVKRAEDEIQVDEGTIGLLTEVQFSLLQPFIMMLEEQPILGADFQGRFQQFYESLSPAERMQLRNHEVKNKCKYRQIKDQMRQRRSPKKQLIKVVERPDVKPLQKTFRNKGSKKDGSYHLTIQNYI